MKINILMIEDHPSQIEGYKTILGFNNSGHEIEVMEAYSSRSAYGIITGSNNIGKFQMIFLDFNLPPYPEKGIFSGNDLAVLIRKTWPETLIVMLTSHCEAIFLYNIFKKVNPEGLLVKSDFTAAGLLTAFDKILSGKKYYTDTARAGIKELLSRESFLDELSRDIIMLLAKGVKTKNMPEILGVSLSSVEKRKQGIRDFLCIEKGTDDDIVTESKKAGLI